MTITEACQMATELNRDHEARGSSTRYVVLTHPIGRNGRDYQIVPRRVGGPACRRGAAVRPQPQFA